MAISVTLRNRLVGFTIVAATLLIFLPVLLSKEMIKRPNPNAVAVNAQGAVVDDAGNLVHQSQPDAQLALNLGQRGELTLAQVSGNKQQAAPAQSQQAAPAQLNQGAAPRPSAPVAPERAAEILTAPAQGSTPPAASSGRTEILTANNTKPQASAAPKPQAQPRPSRSEPEILTAAPRPAPKPAASAPNSDEVVAGTRPTQRYVIQVGVFSRRANADNVVSKIERAGYSVYAIKVNSNGRELYRVYAGDSNDRNSLNPILARINKLCGTKGTIITFNK